jgi:hypothetical protein
MSSDERMAYYKQKYAHRASGPADGSPDNHGRSAKGQQQRRPRGQQQGQAPRQRSGKGRKPQGKAPSERQQKPAVVQKEASPAKKPGFLSKLAGIFKKKQS